MQNLRDWLNNLDETDRLAVINPGVSLKFDLLGILERLEGKKACYFPSPKGHSVPVVGGTLGQRQWVAEALNIKSDDLLPYFQADKNLIVINRALGSKLDPSSDERGLSSKIGMDATTYLNKKDQFYVSKVPGEDKIDLRAVINHDHTLFQEYLK